MRIVVETPDYEEGVGFCRDVLGADVELRTHYHGVTHAG
jgi:hypothetical protein